MEKRIKVFITFIISFVIAYLIVGYIKNGMFVGIKWEESVTIWDKLKEYYVRTASTNIIITLIISIIPTLIIGASKKK